MAIKLVQKNQAGGNTPASPAEAQKAAGGIRLIRKDGTALEDTSRKTMEHAGAAGRVPQKTDGAAKTRNRYADLLNEYSGRGKPVLEAVTAIDPLFNDWQMQGARSMYGQKYLNDYQKLLQKERARETAQETAQHDQQSGYNRTQEVRRAQLRAKGETILQDTTENQIAYVEMLAGADTMTDAEKENYKKLRKAIVEESAAAYKQGDKERWRELDGLVLALDHRTQSALASGVMGAVNELTFGAAEKAAQKANELYVQNVKNENVRNTEKYSPMQWAQAAHPKAYGVGSIAGSVAAMTGLGLAEGEILNGIKGFSSLDKVAKSMIQSGTLFGSDSFLRSAAKQDWDEGVQTAIGNVVIDTVAGTASGTVAGMLGGLTGQALDGWLRANNLWNNAVAVNVARSVSSTASAVGRTGTQEGFNLLQAKLDGEDYSPKWVDIGTSAMVAGLTTFVLGMINAGAETQASKARLEQLQREYAAKFEALQKGATTEERAARNVLEMAKIAAETNQMLTNSQFIGQQKLVDAAQNSTTANLQTLRGIWAKLSPQAQQAALDAFQAERGLDVAAFFPVSEGVPTAQPMPGLLPEVTGAAQGAQTPGTAAAAVQPQAANSPQTAAEAAAQGVTTGGGDAESVAKADGREIVKQLQRNIPQLSGKESVVRLSGTEFQKGTRKLTEQVGDFFRSLGNVVFRKGLGNVILDERGVKSDIGHGSGRAKAITFAAVPSVIENGVQIDFQQNWKGRGYDTYVFAAPVDIRDNRTYVAAVVRSDAQNRLYLHEVVDGNGNLIYRKENAPTAIKTGVTAESGVTGTVGASEGLPNVRVAQPGNSVNQSGTPEPVNPIIMDSAMTREEVLAQQAAEAAQNAPEGAQPEITPTQVQTRAPEQSLIDAQTLRDSGAEAAQVVLQTGWLPMSADVYRNLQTGEQVHFDGETVTVYGNGNTRAAEGAGHEAETGNVLHDAGGEWNDRARAGEQAGSMAGGTGAAEIRKAGADAGAERTALKNRIKELNIQPTPAAALGVQNATERGVTIIPVQEETKTLQAVRARLQAEYGVSGENLRFIFGRIEATGRNGAPVRAEAVAVNGRIYVSADDFTKAEKLAVHEAYHIADGEAHVLTQKNIHALKQSMGEEAFERMVADYILAYDGIYGTKPEDMIRYQAEICADAAAELNRRSRGTGKQLGADRLHSQIDTGANQIEGRSTQSRAPPAQKYSLRDAETPTYEELAEKEPIKVVALESVDGRSYREIREEALRRAEENGWLENPHYNKDTDTLMFVSKETLTHAASNGNAGANLALLKLPEVIENAVLTDIRPPKDMTKAETRVYTLFGAVKESNQVKPVKLTVKEYPVKGENRLPGNVLRYFERNGQEREYERLYDINVLEVTDVESIEKEPDGSGRGYVAGRANNAGKTPSGSTIKVSDLLQSVNSNYQKYIPQSENYSLEEDTAEYDENVALQQQYEQSLEDERKRTRELEMQDRIAEDEAEQNALWAARIQQAERASNNAQRDWDSRLQQAETSTKRERQQEAPGANVKTTLATREELRKNEAKQARVELRARDIPKSAIQSLHANMQNIFSTAKGERAEINDVLDTFAARIVQEEEITAEDRKKLFDQLYASGVVTMEAESQLQEGRKAVRGAKVYLSEQARKALGRKETKALRRRAFASGILLTNDASAPDVRTWNEELAESMPGIFDSQNTDEVMILTDIIEAAERGRDQHMTLDAYANSVGVADYGSVDAFLEEIEKKMDWALQTFAKEADLPYTADAKTRGGQERYAQLSAAAREREQLRDTKIREQYAQQYEQKIAAAREREQQRDTKIREQYAQQYEQKMAAAREREQQRDAKTREQYEQRMAAARAKEQLRAARERERRIEAAERKKQQKELREMQQKTLKSLQWLNKNRKRAPEELQARFDEVLDDIDIYAVAAANETRFSNKYNATWEDLADMYKDARENDPNWLPSKDLQKIVDRLDNRKIAEMDIDALQDLYKAAVGMRTEFYNRKNMMGSMSHQLFDEVYTDSVKELRSAPGGYTGKGIDKFVNMEQLSAINVMERMAGWNPNSTWYKTAKQLEAGERDMRAYVVEANKLLADFLTKNAEWVKRADGQGKDAIWYKIEVPELMKYGEGHKPIFSEKTVTVYMTPSQKVELYLESMNYDNLRHMEGGRTFADQKLYAEGKRGEALAQGTKIRLAPETVKALVRDMTAEEKALADILWNYYNVFAPKRINQVSNMLLGYDRATVKNYAPIFTNESYNIKELGKFEQTAEGVSNLKERTQAKNPTLNLGAFDAFERSVEQTARYVGMAIPARNWNTLLNWQGEDTSMRQAIRETWGDESRKYIEDQIQVLQGEKADKNDSINRLTETIFSNYIGAVFGANPSIVFKQLGSIPLASVWLGGKNVPSLKQLQNVDRTLIAKYTQELDYRTMGYATPETKQLKEHPTKFQTNKTTNFLFGGGAITAMDGWAASVLWPWAENKVSREFPNLEHGTQAQIDAGESPFYKKVAEEFNEAVARSQSTSDEMHQGTLRKSKSGITRTFTMFKSDSSQTYNALRQMAGEAAYYKRTGNTEKQKQAARRLGAAVVAAVGGYLWAEFIEFVMNLWKHRGKRYRDDEGELTAGSVTKEMALGLTGDLAGVMFGGEELVDIIGDVVSGQTWDGINTQGLDALSEIVSFAIKTSRKGAKTAKELLYLAKNGGDVEEYLRRNSGEIVGSIKQIAQNAATYIPGLPVNNLEAYMLGTVRWAAPELAQAYEDSLKNVEKGNLGQLRGNALTQGVKDIYARRSVTLQKQTAQELARLYNQGYTGAITSGIPTSVTVGGEDREMGALQQQKYQKAWQAFVAEELETLMASDTYKAANDETRERYLKKLYKYAADEAKAAVFADYDPGSGHEKVKRITEMGDAFDRVYDMQESDSFDQYAKLREANVTERAAETLSLAFRKAREAKEDGKSLSDTEKYKIVLDAEISDVDRENAVKTIVGDSAAEKLDKLAVYKVTYADYAEFKVKFAQAYPGKSVSQERAKEIITDMSLGAQQRAALWQMVTGTKKEGKNPFMDMVGNHVIRLFDWDRE